MEKTLKETLRQKTNPAWTPMAWMPMAGFLLILGLAAWTPAAFFLMRNLTERRFDQLQDRFDRLENHLDQLEEGLRLAFAEQDRRLSEEAAALKELGGRIERTVSAGTGQTLSRIIRTERVYADLLEEQKKKTLDALYGEEELLERNRRAGEFFRTGKYKQAQELYAAISEAQPENPEARFYRYYALFLLNKNDRNQYRLIREGLMQLERSGYMRDEISEVLSYIAAEETASPE
ncbi:MAG: hypothetical protein LBO80_01465 [Treponema sp.]|jgi:hypothetical protein|nr:hypothetical protein [Treponema sp.]